jgi:hypothetical protein
MQTENQFLILCRCCKEALLSLSLSLSRCLLASALASSSFFPLLPPPNFCCQKGRCIVLITDLHWWSASVSVSIFFLRWIPITVRYYRHKRSVWWFSLHSHSLFRCWLDHCTYELLLLRSFLFRIFAVRKGRWTVLKTDLHCWSSSVCVRFFFSLLNSDDVVFCFFCCCCCCCCSCCCCK